MNPINNQYESNYKGEYQANADQERLLNRLVRAHHITTCGSSGYNLVNGRVSAPI